MNCNAAMHRVLALDNHQVPDPRTLKHLRSCPRCAAEYNRLQPALALLLSGGGSAEKSADAADLRLTDQIMAAVQSTAVEQERAHARFWTQYGKWFFSGVLILGGMMALPYTITVRSLRLLPQARIDATLAVTFGLILSAYIGVFIATHLEDLMRMLRKFQAP
ncbi:MAG: hypothetical protein EA404_09245 [Spirochaetaceae bacterium]|nr:MAG: hypothetical protein EA404_09245 [Spirochaetaceae bacterium]